MNPWTVSIGPTEATSERWPTAPSSGYSDDRFASPTDQGLLVSSAHQRRVDHPGRDASSRGKLDKKGEHTTLSPVTRGISHRYDPENA